MMRKILCVLCFLVFGVVGPLGATPISTSSGWYGNFAWNGGLGGIDSIDNDYLETSWGISVGVDSVMSQIKVWDGYSPGDEFALYVDGAEVAWELTSADSQGRFQAEYNDLFLSAGDHFFTFAVTALSPGSYGGVATAYFSGVDVASAAVPEPATLFLLGVGLLGIAGLKRRNIKR